MADRYVAGHGTDGDREALARLDALRPTVARWCARLAAAPGPASVDHNDLHPQNILVRRRGRLDPARFYDWGDAVLAHPFASLLYALGAVQGDALGVDVQHPATRRMRDAYLGEFADLGDPDELVETVALACRVGVIARALTWDRAVHDRRGRPGGRGRRGLVAGPVRDVDRSARDLVSCTGSSCDKSGDPGGAWQGAARSSYRVFPPGRQRSQASAGRRNYCATSDFPVAGH